MAQISEDPQTVAYFNNYLVFSLPSKGLLFVDHDKNTKEKIETESIIEMLIPRQTDVIGIEDNKNIVYFDEKGIT